ncbi:PASTA domain-containing protein [Pseudonocardia sp. DR1-2]|uniref:PASTA domain-containing protein n=1 Tax=Pseudonocardia sp. DR1-2 TaxID=2951168 RepID=UPI00204320A3|nr:PASTA domain-containing protein [Pseudonocardia sp. DR1-2]MCM3849992.1 PASTA domain-containing protein [Pseudonocardia sp. DR1-2]
MLGDPGVDTTCRSPVGDIMRLDPTPKLARTAALVVLLIAALAACAAAPVKPAGPTVPDGLTGLPMNDARDILEGRGFKLVGLELAPPAPSGTNVPEQNHPEYWVVSGTVPAAGSPVKSHSDLVKIQVWRVAGAPAVATTTAPAVDPQEAAINDAVKAAGLTLPSNYYDSGYNLAKDACGTLRSGSIAPELWLSRHFGAQGGDELRAYEIVLPMMCPEFVPALDLAKSGETGFDDGTYEIGRQLGSVAPGTFRLTGTADDCYWERTSAGGDIIANKFITHGTAVTVTIRASDGSFTSQNCGDWERA